LVGNIVISLLTSWTVLIIFFAFTEPHNAIWANNPTTVKLFRLAFLYAGFAFIISLIREAVKDVEDIEGDARYGCKTLPIVAGIKATKIYAAVWGVVLVASLLVLQLYILQFRWWPAVIYSIVFVILPLVYMLFKLAKATGTKDYSELSKITKLIMFSGILSMVFFRIYF
jgi:4-hydroxybenzoate polyprenyltransferase